MRVRHPQLMNLWSTGPINSRVSGVRADWAKQFLGSRTWPSTLWALADGWSGLWRHASHGFLPRRVIRWGRSPRSRQAELGGTRANMGQGKVLDLMLPIPNKRRWRPLARVLVLASGRHTHNGTILPVQFASRILQIFGMLREFCLSLRVVLCFGASLRPATCSG